MSNEITPVDVLDTMRQIDRATQHLERIIDLQNQIIDSQRAQIVSLRKIIESKDQILQLFGYKGN